MGSMDYPKNIPEEYNYVLISAFCFRESCTCLGEFSLAHPMTILRLSAMWKSLTQKQGFGQMLNHCKTTVPIILLFSYQAHGLAQYQVQVASHTKNNLYVYIRDRNPYSLLNLPISPAEIGKDLTISHAPPSEMLLFIETHIYLSCNMAQQGECDKSVNQSSLRQRKYYDLLNSGRA